MRHHHPPSPRTSWVGFSGASRYDDVLGNSHHHVLSCLLREAFHVVCCARASNGRGQGHHLVFPHGRVQHATCIVGPPHRKVVGGGRACRRVVQKQARITVVYAQVSHTPSRCFRGHVRASLSEYPLGTSLNVLIHQLRQIGQHKAADVESKELGCVANAQFQPNMRRRRVSEARILDLSGYLI